jgi:hypothetical protein
MGRERGSENKANRYPYKNIAILDLSMLSSGAVSKYWRSNAACLRWIFLPVDCDASTLLLDDTQ